MKIMVAGGAGFIGSVLVPLLQDQGHSVTVIDQLWFGNYLPEGSGVVQRDLFTLEQHDFEGFDQVIFLAGLSNDPMAEYSPGRNFIENGALPCYLAFCAKSAGVRRFIYASSCSVYGYTNGKPYDEESPVVSVHPYGSSKLHGERGVLQFRSDDFSTIALRMGTVCGYSPRMRFDLIVNTMYKNATRDGVVTVNNPSIWRPILDVRDTSTAFLRAVQADHNVSGSFNILYDNYTVGDIGAMVCEALESLTGKRPDLDVKNVPDVRNYKVAGDKARAELGFEPRHSVLDIVQNLHHHVAAYRDFGDERFYNIQVFRKMEDRMRKKVALGTA